MADPTSTPTTTEVAPKPQAPAQDAASAAKADADSARAEGDDLAAWKAEARKWEAQAKANASAAAKLADIEESQKSDAERAADALKVAQSEAEQARGELLRYRVAAQHGITDADDIALFLTGSDEDTLTKQAARLAERVAITNLPRAPKPDPNQGRDGATPGTTGDMFAATVQGLLR